MKRMERILAFLLMLTLLGTMNITTLADTDEPEQSVLEEHKEELSEETENLLTQLDAWAADGDGEKIINFFADAPPVPVPDEQMKPRNARDIPGSYMYDVATGNETFDDGMEYVSKTRTAEESSPGYIPDDLLDEKIGPELRAGSYQRVTQPSTKGAYRNTVFIGMVVGGDYTWSGSGYIIGPNHVGTAGHNLYNSSYQVDGNKNKWPRRVYIVAAQNGYNSKPYGVTETIGHEVGGNWASYSDFSDDWGVTKMSYSLGYQTGWLGIHYNDANRNGVTSRTQGYPGVDGYMYEAYGTIITDNGARLYEVSVDGIPGASGSPVLVWQGDQYSVCGIVSQGSGNSIICVRFDSWVFSKIRSYRNG